MITVKKRETSVKATSLKIKFDIMTIEKWFAQLRAIWKDRYKQLDKLLSTLNTNKK